MPPKGRTANRILETGHAPEARAVRGLSARAVPNRRTFVVTSDQPHRADALCLLNDELLDHLGLPGLPALPGSRRATAVADLLVETAQQAIVDDIRPAHDLGRMLKLVSELRDEPLGMPHVDRDAQVSTGPLPDTSCSDDRNGLGSGPSASRYTMSLDDSMAS